MPEPTDREAELRDLTARLAAHEAVVDAWLAKSFTDRVLVVELAEGAAFPVALRRLLADHDCRGANEVYGTGGPDRSAMGAVGDGTRHRFVDVRTRGEYQSYVVD